jgi:hypothetical protein
MIRIGPSTEVAFPLSLPPGNGGGNGHGPCGIGVVTSTVSCPICGRQICSCLLNDREFLARQVGRLLRGQAQGLMANEGGNKRPFPNSDPSDDYDTPGYAFDLLQPYLPKDITVFEGAWGRGVLAGHIERAGYRVIGDPAWDFLTTNPDGWEMLVTNFPYSRKDEFLTRAYALGKPFALLMPIEALGGQRRVALYQQHRIELLVPDKRINYLMDGKPTEAVAFHSAWFCWRLQLPSQVTFVEASW